uniref:Shikimate O-hydroxycinnamoyltransferase n=1 Tax=Davidia involucrata TaxID=16924 RepID=A0A5B6YT63_DAVIN
MAEIRLISTSTVHPASRHESAERIELTPWDLQLLLLDPIQKGLLFLKPTPSEEKVVENTVIDHLKTSLCRTLDFFPPLTGRLAIIENHDDDNTTSFFIDCNNAGAHFIHAVADDLTVTDILDPVYVPPIVHSFFPLNGVLNHQGVSKPLLAVQVTELVDGFFIGCTINHTVGDGSSFWHFFNSRSEISRGFESLSRAPIFKRWFPNDMEIPIRIPLFHKQLVDYSFVPPPLQERVFHFTKEKIAGLKVKANAEMGTTQISSLQALLAHLWRSVVRCRRVINAEQEVTYRLVTGARPRLNPPLPSDYFGNAILPAIVTTKAGKLLLEKGLGK